MERPQSEGLIVPVIVCGGAGTRLWPASRENRPKQFLPLLGTSSTFQDAVRRVSNSALFDRPIVVTNADYRFLVAEQLAAISTEADIILEPVRRDSGPAILVAAQYALSRHRNPLVIVVAGDHVIADQRAFAAGCRAAVQVADQGRIVAFGVQPTRPATEYGYIRAGAPIDQCAYTVEKFVEKPALAAAEQYLAEGYLWNSGNILCRADILVAEYNRFEPDSGAAVAAALKCATRDLGFIKADMESFAGATAKSIDHAVMERSTRIAVVPVSYQWSDVGSWEAVWELASHDDHGNAARESAIFLNSRNCYADSDRQLLALVGVEDLTVIATADAILVASRKGTYDLRRLVQKLNAVAPHLTQDHIKVHRPWGSYQSVDQGLRYQVKRLVVKRGGRLSLQLHHHRAEHWVVVRGTAKVTINDTVSMLHENESIYVPTGAHHRLENPGKIDLELIEVQTGSYLDDDDIVRLEDDYRRS